MVRLRLRTLLRHGNIDAASIVPGVEDSPHFVLRWELGGATLGFGAWASTVWRIGYGCINDVVDNDDDRCYVYQATQLGNLILGVTAPVGALGPVHVFVERRGTSMNFVMLIIGLMGIAAGVLGPMARVRHPRDDIDRAARGLLISFAAATIGGGTALSLYAILA